MTNTLSSILIGRNTLRTQEDAEMILNLDEVCRKNRWRTCLHDFAQTTQHKWVTSKKAVSKVIDDTTKRKFRTRDVNTGYCRLTPCNKRKHTRRSTVLHTAPAIDYEEVEHGKTTTQTTFYDLKVDKQHQLYRSYYELVMYVPWQNTPDDTFLSADVQDILENPQRHLEIDSRHSLQRLEQFFKVYRIYYDEGSVATWHCMAQR